MAPTSSALVRRPHVREGALLAVLGASAVLAFVGVEVAAIGARVAFGPNGPTDLMVLVALYALATRRRAGWGLAAIAVDVVALGATAWGSPAVSGDPGGELVGQVVIDGLVVLFALWQAARRDHVQDLAGRSSSRPPPSTGSVAGWPTSPTTSWRTT